MATMTYPIHSDSDGLFEFINVELDCSWGFAELAETSDDVDTQHKSILAALQGYVTATRFLDKAALTPIHRYRLELKMPRLIAKLKGLIATRFHPREANSSSTTISVLDRIPRVDRSAYIYRPDKPISQ
jgi:hypothetical protein